MDIHTVFKKAMKYKLYLVMLTLIIVSACNDNADSKSKKEPEKPVLIWDDGKWGETVWGK